MKKNPTPKYSSEIHIFLLNTFFVVGLIFLGSWIQKNNPESQPITPVTATETKADTNTTSPNAGISTNPTSSAALQESTSIIRTTPTPTPQAPIVPAPIRRISRGDDD